MTQNEKFQCEYDALEKKQNEKSFGFGVRHVQVFLIFTCLTVAYIMRVDMSVAIVAMTDSSNNRTNIEIFNWNKKTQDVILSSFFWGYVVMQIPSGQLAQRYGAKPLLVVAMLVNGLVTLLTPLAVYMGGWKMVCACRTIQGLTQSCFFPCIHTLAARWIPSHERSRLTNVLFAGTTVGTIIGMPLSSILASTSFGWPCIFYTIGTISILTGVLWLVCGASSPASHPSISAEEKYFIEKSLGHTEDRKVPKTPWRAICTSLPVWAMQIAHIGCNWGFITLLVEIPSYLKMALGIDMKKSGVLSALPYTAMWLGSVLLSFLSDYLVNNKYCSKTVARKIFNSIGTWLPGITLIMLSFIPPNHEVIAIGFIVLTVGIGSGMNMGFMMNPIDLSPNFAGTLVGITNCISNGIGILAPITVGYIVTDEADPTQWRLVFFITSAVYFLTNLFFVIFGSSKTQSWNEPDAMFDVEMVTKFKDDKQQLEKESMLKQEILKR